jgi:MFS family permease
MSPSLHNRWERLRVNAAHLTTGGSWSAQLTSTTQRNLRSFFFDGLFASATDSITVTYLTLYVLALGANSADIGLMTALASLNATLLLIPGAILVDRIGNRKKIVLISSGVVGRICLLLLALIPIFYQNSAVIYIAIGIKVLMDGANNFSLPAWVSLAGDVVPLSWRGRYFGTRNLAMGIAAILVIYGFGQLITWIGSPKGYQWALGLAFVFGITSASFFSRIRDYRDINQKIPAQSYSFKSLFATLKNDRNFLALCGFTALWNFSINIAGPFFNVFLVKDLSATASIIGAVAVVGKISALPSQKFFGNLADRWGSGKLMRLMAFIIPFLPISWFFVQAPWQAIPINIVGGILWAGMNLASFNLLLETSPQEQRARYSAMYQIAVALSTAIGATLGGFVADQWGIRLVFLLSGIGRLIAAIVLFKFVREIQSQPIGLITGG